MTAPTIHHVTADGAAYAHAVWAYDEQARDREPGDDPAALWAQWVAADAAVQHRIASLPVEPLPAWQWAAAIEHGWADRVIVRGCDDLPGHGICPDVGVSAYSIDRDYQSAIGIGGAP